MRIPIVALALAALAGFSSAAPDAITPPRGYNSETLRRGNCAKKVTPGDVATVSFSARIAPSSSVGERGAVFDSSKPEEPLRIVAGSDDTIPGWSYGVIGMCGGERRRLTIPPEWAFGSEGFMRVPGGATIELTLELVDVSTPPNLFAEIDANRDNRVTRQELMAWLLGKGVPRSEVGKVADELIRQDDRNSDGVIEWSEYSGPRGAAPARTLRTLAVEETDDTAVSSPAPAPTPAPAPATVPTSVPTISIAPSPGAVAVAPTVEVSARAAPADLAMDVADEAASASADDGDDADDDADGDNAEEEDHTRFRDIERERARLLASGAPAGEINERLMDMGLPPMPTWRPEFDRFTGSQ